MEPARFLERAAFEAARGDRGFAWNGPGLWIVGSLEALERPCVAVVGTRAASMYGKRVAHAFARDLVSGGICVISGLALGVDASAHEGALANAGTTVGVLGGGHERFFPRRNIEISARMIASGGAVLSSYPPEHPAFPHQFLERNGIVAALADAVVVIEAPMRSGALNTAHWAAERIPVFAVPGDVDRAHVQGCLALLRDGATLARSAADVLEALRFSAPARPPRIERDGLAGELLDLLAHGERGTETLIESTTARAPEVLATLALLELEGLVQSHGALYALAQSAML